MRSGRSCNSPRSHSRASRSLGEGLGNEHPQCGIRGQLLRTVDRGTVAGGECNVAVLAQENPNLSFIPVEHHVAINDDHPPLADGPEASPWREMEGWGQPWQSY